MQIWAIQTLNSLALGGLLFMLSSGFALIFGLMRIANLTHGAMFMIGTYVAATVVRAGHNLLLAALAAMVCVAVLGGLIERLLLRRLGGNSQAQVLATLGLSFVAADVCLMIWGGDPIPVQTPTFLQAPLHLFGLSFPAYRLVVLAIAIVVGLLLYLLIERTRLGAMIRAGVDDMAMARAAGIPASLLFSIVFCLGAALAGLGGTLAGPIFNAYPGLDAEMLPLALIVVILGGIGSLTGTFFASFIVGFIYTFGIFLVPDLAYVVLFLPMVVVLAFRPNGLFGRSFA
ncbi:branched-chain amino acid ABC transporter permease [Ramlibacter sp.]|uniref:branched-chain amino acid ABC transporter permease n=1 Tax=Ramlibacter sp. TaxID=1917967 RepID=UPI002604AD65|nr:branched-chain amino acid ABC transporter permease [Ramlibacter sp.]MDB5955622.1 branched-chain amino acid transporter permease [Ramlibacter sp.]